MSRNEMDSFDIDFHPGIISIRNSVDTISKVPKHVGHEGFKKLASFLVASRRRWGIR